MAHRLTIPGTTYIGENALADALADISALGKHALIVSGNSMKKAGHLEMLTARLRENGVSSTVFSGITGEPTDIMVESGTALYRECGADFIIGFGGNVIDIAIRHPIPRSRFSLIVIFIAAVSDRFANFSERKVLKNIFAQL